MFACGAPRGDPLAIPYCPPAGGLFFVRGGAQPLGAQGFAPAGASKGFPLALATFECLCGAFLCEAAHCRWGRRVSRLRARARAFRSPLQPSGVAFLGGVGMASRARSTGKSSAATALGGVVMCKEALRAVAPTDKPVLRRATRHTSPCVIQATGVKTRAVVAWMQSDL